MKIYDSNAKKEPLLKEAFLTLEMYGGNEVSLNAVDDNGTVVAYLARIGPYGIQFFGHAKQRLTEKGYMLNTTFDEAGTLQAVQMID